ncbi:MAG: NAD(P)/FAD-dependent oxidoreductase [Gemmatimonadales bacterium]
MSSQAPMRVVVLGGGFAGVHAAIELERAMPRGAEVDITIVNRDNFVLFTPMLHEVAASDLDVTHIVNPIRRMVRRAVLFVGEVEEIDLPGRRVLVRHAQGGHEHALEYDHLVLALGSVTNFFDLPGLEERALTMKSLADAIALRNRLIEVLEEADFECAAVQRRVLLTILVAGGGFAGVETAAAANDFLREAIAAYPRLSEDMVRLVLVHSGPTILPELDARLGGYAAKALARRGVDIRLGTRVTGVSEEGVSLSDGTSVPAQTVVWTAGTAPNPILADLPCRRQGGRILADEFLAVPDWPGVWALGDCAMVPNRKDGGFYPPTAQHALRQGRVLGRNIAAAFQGRALRPFVFSTLGQLAAIGRRTGVANILGVNFSGFLAWWLWRSIYLSKLPGLDRKVRVALDWTLDLLLQKDLVQLRAERAPGRQPVGAG